MLNKKSSNLQNNFNNQTIPLPISSIVDEKKVHAVIYCGGEICRLPLEMFFSSLRQEIEGLKKQIKEIS